MYDAWYLRNMSQAEQSWINSRIGIADNQIGNKIISKDDIKKDSEKVRIYDYQYDMYLDEFDDFEGEVLS